MNIILKNVDMNAFRSIFDRSLVVTNGLDFSISSEFIKSSVSNDDQNFWKEWQIPNKGIFETDTPFNEVKVLFSNGIYFKTKYLGLFGNQKCEITIQVNGNNEAENFVVNGKTTFGTPLTVKMRCTRYEMAKDKLDVALHDGLFNHANSQVEFEIAPSIIAEINKMRFLNSMSDAPQSYVTFKGENGVLTAFDTTFSFEIGTYSGIDFEAKFPKKSLTLIDNEPHIFKYCKNPDEYKFEWMLLVSKHATIKSESVAMLMTSFAASASNIDEDDLFDSGEGWGLEDQ